MVNKLCRICRKEGRSGEPLRGSVTHDVCISQCSEGHMWMPVQAVGDILMNSNNFGKV